MKKIILVLLAFTCFTCGCSSIYTRETSKSEITTESVNIRILYNEISNKVNEEYLESVLPEKDAASQYQNSVLPTAYDLVITELERDILICKLCKKNNILLSKETVKSTVDNEYKNLKMDESQKHYYDILIACLKEYEIAEAASDLCLCVTPDDLFL